jgi:nucleoside-diphosphate-sugar epimerase
MNEDVHKELHVIFGTGPLGLAVMRELHRRNKRIRMVNTSGRAEVPLNVEIVKADVYSFDAATAAAKGAKVVYQCAAPVYSDWVDRFVPLQTAIMKSAKRNNAKFVVGDNLYMYGDVDGLIHEGLPSAAITRKGIVRARAAELALAEHRKGDLRVVIARGSDFFGPHVRNALIGARAITPALKGKTAGLIGNLDVPHSFTFIDDFGRALVMLAESDDTYGQVWHVPNTIPVTQREMMKLFFAQIGKTAKVATMSPMLINILSLFIRDLQESKEMMYALHKPYIVDSSKFEKRFGVNATPLHDAISQTLSWYRANPH